MITIIEGYRLDADNLQSVARMLYEHPSIGIRPILCYVHSISGLVVVVSRRKYPGDGWFALVDSQNRETGWYFPVLVDE